MTTNTEKRVRVNMLERRSKVVDRARPKLLD